MTEAIVARASWGVTSLAMLGKSQHVDVECLPGCAHRFEIAHVERHGRELVAVGAQLGAAYELRYRLDGQTLALEVAGQRSVETTDLDERPYPLPFHPLELAEETLRGLFGFNYEGLYHDDDPDLEKIVLSGFTVHPVH